MRQSVFGMFRDFSVQMKKQNISAFAASTAFFLFLSLMPMLIVICAIIPFTPLTEQNLVAAITEVTPDAADLLAEGLIHEVYEKSAGILSIAVLTTLWAAGKGVLALIRGLNAINDVDEERNYFFVRMVASFYTLIMLLILIVSLFIMVFGNALVGLVLTKVPQLQVLVSFIMNFRFVFVWMILTILFAMIYAYIPNIKLKFKKQLPGAMFSAIVWSTFSWGFSMYVGWEQASGMYGSLSIVIIVMLWMYFCMYIIMLGAYLNRYFNQMEEVFYN